MKNNKHKILRQIKLHMAKRGVREEDLLPVLGLGDKSQGYLSRLLNGRNPLSLDKLISLADFFEMSVSDLLNIEDDSAYHKTDNKMDESEYFHQDLEEILKDASEDDNSYISLDPHHITYRGILGTYYWYCRSSISEEKFFLKGTLELKKSNNICLAILKLGAEKHNVKKSYIGQAFTTGRENGVYIIMVDKIDSDVCCIVFRHMQLNRSLLQCRLCGVLSISSGQDRRPILMKSIISRTELSDDDLNVLSGQLKLNNKMIYIEKDIFDNILKKMLKPNFSIELNEKTIYEIDESLIEQSNIVNLLRQYSIDQKYAKISSQADTHLFNYIQQKLDE